MPPSGESESRLNMTTHLAGGPPAKPFPGVCLYAPFYTRDRVPIYYSFSSQQTIFSQTNKMSSLKTTHMVIKPTGFFQSFRVTPPGYFRGIALHSSEKRSSSLLCAHFPKMGLAWWASLRLARSNYLRSRRPGPPTPVSGRRAGG